MCFHDFRRSLWEVFRREQLLGAQVTFDDISLLRGVALGSSVGDSRLVTGLPLITFHYFWGVLWEAFRRGQLLSNWATFDDFSLLRGVTLESLPSGTAA